MSHILSSSKALRKKAYVPTSFGLFCPNCYPKKSSYKMVSQTNNVTSNTPSQKLHSYKMPCPDCTGRAENRLTFCLHYGNKAYYSVAEVSTQIQFHTSYKTLGPINPTNSILHLSYKTPMGIYQGDKQPKLHPKWDHYETHRCGFLIFLTANQDTNSTHVGVLGSLDSTN